jgi:hypothetical protein
MLVRFAVASLVTTSWVLAPAQTVPQQQQPTSLIERACAGESAAQSELEENASSEDLKRMMHDTECWDNAGARLLLAKRGDPEALQFYACRSLTDKLDVLWELTRSDLPQIGGEFTVEIYRQLLDSDQRFRADFDRVQSENSDMLMLPLSDGVLPALQKLAPGAPIPSLTPLQLQVNREAMERIKSMWRSWIDSHPPELMQMKPTAEGVSFNSDACAGVSDLSTLERRLKEIAGDQALVCEPDPYDSSHSTEATNKCVKKAFASGKAFYTWYVLGGSMVWNVAVAVAGDGTGNVYVVSFDDAGARRAGLGKEVQVFDAGATVVVKCPKPIKFREAFSGNLTCIDTKGSISLSPD